MDLNPPEGSKILITDDGVQPTIVIPQASSPTRYLGGLFLLCWLGGWAVGFKAVLSQIASGHGNAFHIFWLTGWTIGGIFAAMTAYRAFRPTAPERLMLGSSSLSYDSGVPPFEFNSAVKEGRSRSFADSWKNLFPKRVRIELTPRQLQSLRLRETNLGNRLTLDVDAERIDLASGASEIEREWLARYLARRYSLRQVLAAPAES